MVNVDLVALGLGLLIGFVGGLVLGAALTFFRLMRALEPIIEAVKKLTGGGGGGGAPKGMLGWVHELGIGPAIGEAINKNLLGRK